MYERPYAATEPRAEAARGECAQAACGRDQLDRFKHLVVEQCLGIRLRFRSEVAKRRGIRPRHRLNAERYACVLADEVNEPLVKCRRGPTIDRRMLRELTQPIRRIRRRCQRRRKRRGRGPGSIP